MYRLCYELNILQKDELLHIPVDFNFDINSFRAAVNTLNSLQKNVDRIKYVESAYQEFLELKNTLREYTRNNQMNLERKTRSFFVEFNIFLDHWQKYIGHQSDEELAKSFTQLTHDAFDTSDDYAMATIIRNYIVHSSDIIQGTIWGNTYYDVGFFKYELLKDRLIKKKKRKILERQAAEFIMLNPIMKGALEKVQGIQEALLTYMINTTDMNNAIATVEEGIKKIKKYGDKEWFFFKDDGQRFITKDQSGQTIKYIRGKCLEVLPWKELDKLLDTIDKI